MTDRARWEVRHSQEGKHSCLSSAILVRGATRDDRYKPVFEPAVAVLEVLPRLRFVSHGLSNDEAEPDAIKAFWSVSSKLRRKIRGDADAWARSKPAKVALAAKYWSQRSQVLLAARCDTISGRITALWSSHPSVGTGRVPVSNQGKVESKAVAAWWNSTPARLMLLNLRSKKLTYPKWSVAQLLTVCIPKPDNPAWLSLAEAWKEACDIKMLPLSQGEYRRARGIIDRATAQALDVDEEQIAEWRRMLAVEPTISNLPAP